MHSARLTLTILGADSVFGAQTCAHCWYSPAGCCVTPPRYDWSDLGRVVSHGGRDWLLARIGDGSLVPVEHGFAVRRRHEPLDPEHPAHGIIKCTFHTSSAGCSIEETRRPATCNFYMCTQSLDAAAEAGDSRDAERALRVHDRLVDRLAAWDAVLHARVVQEWPADRRQTAAFFTWLGKAFSALHASTLAMGDSLGD